MPLLVLLLAALVGTLAGLVCGLFESGVHWLAEQRIALLADRPWWQLGLLGFGFSALLGFVGYFLTHTFAPEAGGSGIPEIEGAMDDLRPVRWWRARRRTRRSPWRQGRGAGAVDPRPVRRWCGSRS